MVARSSADTTPGANALGQVAEHDLSPEFLVSSERFSTQGLSSTDRVEKWESHNAKAIFGLKATTIDDESFDATEINLNLPKLTFHHVSANAHVIERTTQIIRKKPIDSVLMFFALYGDAFFYHPQGVRALGPGTAVLCDGDKPFMRGFARGLKEMVLVVPKPFFAELTDDATPYRNEPHVSTFGAAGKGAGFTTDIATLMSEALRERSSPRLLEIDTEVADSLRGLFGGVGSTRRETQFRVVSSLIERHMRNPKLSANLVATEMRISERQLSRILASEGQSLPALLTQRRLELAMRVLSSPRATTMSIGEVSAYCGFSSHAHFSRAFRARYGFPPSAVEKVAHKTPA